jgi:hypothetical protein
MNNKFKLNELFFVSDGNDKYFYGEIKRNNDILYGKIFIRDHEILAMADTQDKLGKCVEDAISLILYNDILNKKLPVYVFKEFVLSLN